MGQMGKELLQLSLEEIVKNWAQMFSRMHDDRITIIILCFVNMESAGRRNTLLLLITLLLLGVTKDDNKMKIARIRKDDLINEC